MLNFAVRRREPDSQPDWIADVDVAARLGIDRATVWRWADAVLIPAPKRIGTIQLLGGRTRSRTTRWLRPDIELFTRCTDMAEFRQLKHERDQAI